MPQQHDDAGAGSRSPKLGRTGLRRALNGTVGLSLLMSSVVANSPAASAASIDGGRVWRDSSTGILIPKPSRDYYRTPQLVAATERIGRVAKAAGIPIVFAYVPRKQEALRSLMPSYWSLGPTYRAKSQLMSAYRRSGATLDLSAVVGGQPSYWFKTDHHWNHRGAVVATRAIIATMKRAGIPVGPVQGTFNFRSDYPPFFGSTARSIGLRSAEAADRIIVPVATAQMNRCTGPNFARLTCGLPIYEQGLARSPESYAIRYRVYLGGDSGVTIINGAGTGTLLMTKDSFGSPVATLLAPRFKRIVVIDERHFTGSKLSQVIKSVKPDGMLMLHSLTVMHGYDWRDRIWS